MKNTELFNLLVGRIFAELYRSFPVPIDLEPAAFLEDLGEEIETALDQKPKQFFSSTVYWLRRQDYIEHQSPTSTSIARVVLTEKGLQALSAVPASVAGEATQTIGDALAGAAKTAAGDAGKTFISRMVAELFDLGVRVAGSS